MIDKQIVAAFEESAAPAVAINKIALSYTEKLIEMNLSVLRKQADAAFAGWREALAVRDAGAVKDYLARQGEVARDVIGGYVADAKAVAELNQEVANELRKVVEESIAKASKLAA